MINKTEYAFHNAGVSYEKNGKKFMIQHPYIKKTLIHKAVRLHESNCGKIIFVTVTRKINGRKYEGAFNTEREALRYIDTMLIKEGREPEYILKKT